MSSFLLKRGTLAKVDAYVGEDGELVLIDSLNKIRIGDGSTPGGNPLQVDIADVIGLTTALSGKLGKTANAVSASKLDTARRISLGGDATGQVDFDGTDNVTIPVVVKDDSHNHIIGNVDGLQAALNAKLDDSQRGAANGVAPLDSSSKIPVANLPASVVGGLNYKGAWNASTNTPALSAAEQSGNYYKVSVAGSTNLGGTTDWKVGDWVISNGSGWDKIDNTDSVSTVAGKSGAVSLDIDDIIGLQGALDGKANASHSHSWSSITSKPSTFTPTTEVVQDIVGAMVSGNYESGLSVAYQDSDGTLDFTLTRDMTITLAGDLTGSITMTDLNGGTLSATIKDDSHNHIISNVDGLQTALNGKLGSTANAASASKLQSARRISLSGDASGQVDFDGSGNVTIPVTIGDDSHNHTVANVDGLQGALDNKLGASATAVKAKKWETPRTITVNGDASGSVSFDGSQNKTLTITVNDDSHNHTVANIDGLQERLDEIEAVALALGV